MLSVNRTVKIIIIPLIIFCIPNIAFPDKAFDVNGINIGDDYKKIKNQINCRDMTKKIGNKDWVNQLVCENNGAYDNSFLIDLDHEGRVTQINRRKIFSVEPDFQKIKNQLYSKYGEPDQVGHSMPGPENHLYEGYTNSFCWGVDCKQVPGDGRHWIGSGAGSGEKGKFLLISYYSYSKDPNVDSSFYCIDFKLLDNDWHDRENKWKDKEYKIYQDKIKDQESDLHL